MPIEEKNFIRNEPPRIRGVIMFTLLILGLIFFRGIYNLEVKSLSLGTFISPVHADVPQGEAECSACEFETQNEDAPQEGEDEGGVGESEEGP